MPFIGNSVQNQGFAPAVDYFNGDGTTVTFTLSRPVASVAQLTAVIENVIQNPGTAFTVSGNQITFTSAPPSGTGNIWVEYTSLITQYNGISENPSVVGDLTMSGGLYARGDFGSAYDDGTVVDYITGAGRITVGELDDLSFYHGGYYTREEMLRLSYQGNHKFFGTGALTIPVGTTAQRPGSPAFGMTRFNSTLGYPEWYDASTSSWVPFSYSTYDAVDYLIVAGGGGGASGFGGIGGGGGGAGGYVSGTTSLIPGTAYTVTIGAGGAGASSSSSGAAGISGSNSSFGGLTAAVGGGFGRSWISGDVAGSSGSGGSGGGGTYLYITPGSGASGQGNAGGTGSTNASVYGGGGGGGANAAGANGSGSSGGNGGAGLNWQSLGTFYAGGGGGGSKIAPSGTGGTGGGGNGGAGASGSAGTANRGGGGGGGGESGYIGGTGGSGIVVIRYPGAQRATGGTVTSSGGYTYHTFTTSGTLTA